MGWRPSAYGRGEGGSGGGSAVAWPCRSVLSWGPDAAASCCLKAVPCYAVLTHRRALKRARRVKGPWSNKAMKTPAGLYGFPYSIEYHSPYGRDTSLLGTDVSLVLRLVPTGLHSYRGNADRVCVALPRIRRYGYTAARYFL